MSTPSLQVSKLKVLEVNLQSSFLFHHLAIRKSQWIFFPCRWKSAPSHPLSLLQLGLSHTTNHWVTLLPELSASALPSDHPSLTAVWASDAFRTKVGPCLALLRALQCAPIALRVTPRSSHRCTDPVWSAPSASLLPFTLLSLTGLCVVSKSQHTHPCLRAFAPTTIQSWMLLCTPVVCADLCQVITQNSSSVRPCLCASKMSTHTQHLPVSFYYFLLCICHC